MCMYTSLVERTPAAGRQANLSAGVASANAINCRETCLHSPSYPCQIPSGGAWANNMGVLIETHNNAFAKRVLTINWLKRSLDAVKEAHLAENPKDLERKVHVADRDATVDGMYLRIIVAKREMSN